MRVIECEQGSEQWELLRMTRPTASCFGNIITPKRGDLSATCVAYACELVAKQMGVYTEAPPSFWMEWGTEHEPSALAAYSQDTGSEVEQVGFVLPDSTDRYGGSPDGLVDNRTGILETKCPKPETLLRYHWDGGLPDMYRPQVQGLLLITGCEWCDFFAWHPEVAPFSLRVEADEKYQQKMSNALDEFCDKLDQMIEKMSKAGVHIIKWEE